MQCTARTRNGERCRTHAIQGGTVCRMHGGAAPQVKAKAAQRLADARDKALLLLMGMIDDDRVSDKVALDTVVKLSELVETLEGRVARREEQINVAESDLDLEIKTLLGTMADREESGAQGQTAAEAADQPMVASPSDAETTSIP